ncbi:MAG: hypothetical protein GC162_06715 [Planctomycetes bacterium]|nr:hypothetical protein [Planctomycetota bacterium]
MLITHAAASAQLLDLRTLSVEQSAWDGFDAGFAPTWIGDTQTIFPSDWNGGGGTANNPGGSGSDSGGFVVDFTGGGPSDPSIVKPKIYHQHIDSVLLIDQLQWSVASARAEAADHVADSINASADPGELSQFAQIVLGEGPAVNPYLPSQYAVALSEAVAHLTASTTDSRFAASGKVGVYLSANAQSAGGAPPAGTPPISDDPSVTSQVKPFGLPPLLDTLVLPPASSAHSSASVVSQAMFDLKTVTQFDLTTTIAKAGAMGLDVAIYQEGNADALMIWNSRDAKEIDLHTYGVLDAGRYLLRIEARADADAAADASALPSSPITQNVSDIAAQTGQFDVQFDLGALQYWYYTLAEDGSGPRLLPDSLITVQVYDPSMNRYIDAQMTLADAYRDLEPTGWFDVAGDQWIDSPLEALQFDLPTGITEAQFLAQTQRLLSLTPVPEPTAALIFAAPLALLRRRRRPGL